ncbi:MAG TPA: TetR/AcrR family transcriptional regulator [Dinghuibacter sp.]|jgi:AcrR family transcriptional regulator|uniref:TetR/AcrR family transcriptional regulator n=1 Tax=Dinghuibacter sp. TaxID=2024697 RepID=UPI002CCDF3F9|nr:TetR/AcrR family transcriptional regulator [Dinghuibacter sp.]HTJ12263.1 TetR/AcrR family transcriptional regulator [Dinghuibacter sp.]
MDQTTEDIIRNSARKVFTAKGFSGARMQDIADEAGINRALLHYYFRSKERLFEVIFDEAFNRFLGTVQPIMVADIPLFEKIEQLVEAEIALCEAHPCNAMFIMHEMMQNPAIMERRNVTKLYKVFLETFQKALQEEHKAGKVIRIEAEQLFLHIISLILFPFIGKAYVQKAFDLDEEGYWKMIQRRKKEVARFVINAIKVC